MSRIMRFVALLVVVGAFATALVAYATAGPKDDESRFQATFSETVQVVTNRIADYGIVHVILTGSGTLEGFGAVTEVGGVTQDSAVRACGPTSGSAVVTRRIITAKGILAIHESNDTCDTPAGRVATGTFEVDGLFSTGVFAGATGRGAVLNLLGPHTLKLSGRVKLAHDNDDDGGSVGGSG